MKELRRVHQSYLEVPTEGWLVANGGRCYKESEVRQNFVQNVKCPLCSKERWFSSQSAYLQHWMTLHKGR